MTEYKVSYAPPTGRPLGTNLTFKICTRIAIPILNFVGKKKWRGAENIPQSYLWIIPNSGHSTPINYSKQFNENINDFFKTPYRIIEGMDRLN